VRPERAAARILEVDAVLVEDDEIPDHAGDQLEGRGPREEAGQPFVVRDEVLPARQLGRIGPLVVGEPAGVVPRPGGHLADPAPDLVTPIGEEARQHHVAACPPRLALPVGEVVHRRPYV